MSALLDKLNNDPATTEADVLAYLAERVAWGRQAGGTTLPPDQFWQPGDLARYRAAAAWWPADAPPRFQLSPLGSMCGSIVTGAGMEVWPFMRLLTHRWEQCRTWLESEGRNVGQPNETKEERRRRLGREATARSRANKAAAEHSPELAERQRLHAAYIEACRVRKAAVQAAHDEHTPAVDAAKAAWDASKGTA